MYDYDSARGMTFVRLAIAKAIPTITATEKMGIAARRWGRDSPVVSMIQRSAVAGGEASSGDFGDLVDIGAAAREFLDVVAPLTILGRLEGLRRVAAHVPYVRSAGTAIAYWVGESKAIPVSPAAFDRQTMVPLKVACMLVVSNDLLRDTSPLSEAMIRRDMLRAVSTASDLAFVDPSNAGSAGVSPASITNGGTVIASTDDLALDLENLIGAFTGDFQTAAFVLSPRLAAQIALATGGKGLGAGLGLRGGELLGLPAIVSAASPASTDGGSLALVDAANIVAVDEGAEVAISTNAMVEQDDAPQGATDTPVAATATRVGMFQSDSSAIRMIRHVNWAANAGSVIVVTGANYAAA